MREKKIKVYREAVECIRFHMNARDLNQRALAKRAKILEVNVSRALNGVRPPNLYILIALCRALDITPNDALGFGRPLESADVEISRLKEKIIRIGSILKDD